MTLRTTIVAFSPMAVEPLFRYCQSLLGDPEAMVSSRYRAGDPYAWSDRTFHDNNGIENETGQGLGAILRVEYGADGPVGFDEEDNTPRGALMSVSFETNSNPDAGDLHAQLVTSVTEYLRGPSAWQLESTGQWFSGLEELGRLAS